MKNIKVLIVDDSALIRSLVRELLSGDEQIQVVGEAEDPFQARDLIKQLNPDVLTLDVEMPKMDGITFLSNLMRLRPMPVVMLSTLTTKGADITLEALELGAVDFIAKPKVDALVQNKSTFKSILINKIKSAFGAENRSYKVSQLVNKVTNDEPLTFNANSKSTQLIAIGASTGGTEAIKAVVTQLPDNAPPVVVTQHIPPTFSERFANRLDGCSKVSVCEAKHGQKIKPGHVYIAPGDRHLKIETKAGSMFCILEDSQEVNRHKPSVDVMFDSLTPIASKVQVVLLTGMGNDGACGMQNLKNAGARTIIQDQHTSLIWGMPGSASKLNAQTDELPIYDIAKSILAYAEKSPRKAEV